MPWRDGCSQACSASPARHDECNGIGMLDQDGSQLLCRCECHRRAVTYTCPKCMGKGKITTTEHEGVRRVTAPSGGTEQ